MSSSTKNKKTFMIYFQTEAHQAAEYVKTEADQLILIIKL